MPAKENDTKISERIIGALSWVGSMILLLVVLGFIAYSVAGLFGFNSSDNSNSRQQYENESDYDYSERIRIEDEKDFNQCADSYRC